MKLFGKMYDWAMTGARHPKSPYYLSGMSFAESVFFPVPVDVMLAPMALARPDRAWHYAMLATLFSVIGGVIGYFLGYALLDTVVMPIIESVGYQDKMELATQWFIDEGIWVIFIASFSPIPYKVFTITAGMMSMAMLPFVLASIVGRGLRFFLVAGLMKLGGAKMEHQLKKWIDIIGWATVALIVVAWLYFR